MIPLKSIAKKMAARKVSSAAPAIEDQTDDMAELKKKAISIGLTAMGIGVSALVLRKAIKKFREKRTEKRFNDEDQQALLLRSAMNPSGAKWLIHMDGTNEDAIYSLASQITNFKKVQKAYQNLYGNSLLKDLQKELDTDDFSRFMNIVDSKIGSFPNSEKSAKGHITNSNSKEYLKGKILLIQKQTKLYRKFTWFPLGSIKTVSPGTFINFLTSGKSHKVSVWPKVYTYIHVFIKTREGKNFDVYANKQDVLLVSKEEYFAGYKGKYRPISFNNSDF